MKRWNLGNGPANLEAGSWEVALVHGRESLFLPRRVRNARKVSTDHETENLLSWSLSKNSTAMRTVSEGAQDVAVSCVEVGTVACFGLVSTGQVVEVHGRPFRRASFRTSSMSPESSGWPARLLPKESGREQIPLKKPVIFQVNPVVVMPRSKCSTIDTSGVEPDGDGTVRECDEHIA